jgi:hypothetical protein
MDGCWAALQARSVLNPRNQQDTTCGLRVGDLLIWNMFKQGRKAYVEQRQNQQTSEASSARRKPPPRSNTATTNCTAPSPQFAHPSISPEQRNWNMMHHISNIGSLVGQLLGDNLAHRILCHLPHWSLQSEGPGAVTREAVRFGHASAKMT